MTLKKKAATLSKDLTLIFSVLGIIVALNVVSSWWFARLDLSEGHQYSISPATKTVLKKLDDIINIKVFFSKDLPAQARPVQDQVRDLLAEFGAYGGRNLQITWEDPGKTDEGKRKAQEMGVQEVQLNTYEKDKAAVMMAYMSIAVVYGDKKEVVELAQGMSNLEYDLAQAIMRVSRTSIPKVAVLKTDTTAFIPDQVRMQMRMGQSDPTKELFEPIFQNLDKNYQVDLVNTREGEKISSDYRTLIVPGGSNFTDRDLFEIDQFFMGGGNLIVLAEPVKIDFQYGVNARVQESKMLDMLEHYGARVERKLALDVVCGQVQIPQRIGMFEIPVAREYPYFVAIASEGFKKGNPAVSTALSQVIFPWPSPITLLAGQKLDTSKAAGGSLQKVSAEVLVSSSPKSWSAAEPFNLNPIQQWKLPAEGLGKQNLLVHLSGDFTSYFKGKSIPGIGQAKPGDTLSQIKMRPEDANRQIKAENTNAHLIVAGNAGFATKQNGTPGNVALLQNLVDWLSLDNNLINIRSRAMIDRSLHRDNLKEGSIVPSVVRWTNILLMPILLAIAGIIIFLGRREPAIAAPAVSVKTEEKSA